MWSAGLPVGCLRVESASQFGDVCGAGFAAAADYGCTLIDPAQRVVGVGLRPEVSACLKRIDCRLGCDLSDVVMGRPNSRVCPQAQLLLQESITGHLKEGYGIAAMR